MFSVPGEEDGDHQYEEGGQPEGHHPAATQPRAADGTEVSQPEGHHPAATQPRAADGAEVSQPEGHH